ncbi:39S ribosomal protein L35, mitochondrial [Sergentomyia squamirostris]
MLRLATNFACRWSVQLYRTTPKNISLRTILGSQEVLNRSFSTSHATKQPAFQSPLGLSCNPQLLCIANSISVMPSRTVTKFSMQSGKRKSVKAALKRFYRLDWGIWIRTRSGRHKRMWRKTSNRKRRLRQHVFVNSTQSYLLDKMVTKFWRTPKHYVEDDYRPYHSREECYQTKKRTDQ